MRNKKSLTAVCLVSALITFGCNKSSQNTTPSLEDYRKNLNSPDLGVKVNAIVQCYKLNDKPDEVAQSAKDTIHDPNCYLFADSLESTLIGLKSKGFDLTADIQGVANDLPASKARSWSQVLDDMAAK